MKGGKRRMPYLPRRSFRPTGYALRLYLPRLTLPTPRYRGGGRFPKPLPYWLRQRQAAPYQPDVEPKTEPEDSYAWHGFWTDGEASERESRRYVSSEEVLRLIEENPHVYRGLVEALGRMELETEAGGPEEAEVGEEASAGIGGSGARVEAKPVEDGVEAHGETLKELEAELYRPEPLVDDVEASAEAPAEQGRGRALHL